MPTEKETLYIAFSTQKGGAGKTTLTVLAASYLHYVKGLNVAVVDCDYPQHSIAEMRKRDLKTVMEDETLQGDGLPPTATYRQEGLPGRRGHGGGCRGKGGRTIGEAARHGHRVLRPCPAR